MSPRHGERGDAARTITNLCEQALQVTASSGLSGVSVTMHAPGLIDELLYASDPDAQALFEIQTLLGEGPSVEAQRSNCLRLEGDLLDDVRAPAWIGFGGEVGFLGVRAIWSIPIQVGAVCLGVITFHGSGPVVHNGALLATALRLADDVMRAMLSPAADDDPQLALSDIPGRRLQIHQAAGMVMVQLGVSLSDAMLALQGAAFASGRGLPEVADDIVNRRLRLDEESTGEIPGRGGI